MKSIRPLAVICLLVSFTPVGFAVFAAGTAGGSAAPQVPSAAPAAPPSGPLLNPKQPQDGLLTGGFAGPEGFPVLAGEGYKTYIDLRSDAEVTPEQSAAAVAAGLRLERIPIAGEGDLNLASARALDTLLADRSLYPVVVACGSGNRVGALLALRAFWLDGATAEAALELGRRAGLTKMEPSVRILLGLPPTPVPEVPAPAPQVAPPADRSPQSSSARS